MAPSASALRRHGEVRATSVLIASAGLTVDGGTPMAGAPLLERDWAQAWAGMSSRLTARRNANVAEVALANKTARVVWALLAHDREFRPDYTAATAAA